MEIATPRALESQAGESGGGGGGAGQCLELGFQIELKKKHHSFRSSVLCGRCLSCSLLLVLSSLPLSKTPAHFFLLILTSEPLTSKLLNTSLLNSHF